MFTPIRVSLNVLYRKMKKEKAFENKFCMSIWSTLQASPIPILERPFDHVYLFSYMLHTTPWQAWSHTWRTT